MSRPLMMAGLVLGYVCLQAQTTPETGSQQSARFEAGTSAVVVDVVVRDKNGPVTDLTVDDFEVFEDGERQTIATFERRVPGSVGSTSSTAVSLPGVPGSPGARLSVTALAWDHLSPEGRALADQAARTLVSERQADELVGVFVVDRALRVIQPYTTNETELLSAVGRASTTATTETGRERNTLLEDRLARPSTSPTAGAEQGMSHLPGTDPREPGLDPSGNPTVLDPIEAAIRETLQRMENSYEQLLSEIQGQSSMYALLALVDSLGEIPGRKTVVYLCEGLTVAPSVEAQYRAVMETANRKNVSIYALDTAGLRVQSEQAEVAREIRELAAPTISGFERDNSKKWSEDFERNEQLLLQDPATSLGILTSETGGLLIQNTNDLQKGIARINDDRRNYYLLTYSPTNPVLDGTFRHIEVKAHRKGVDVQARRGYLAVPANEAAPVLSYEVPALAALAASPAPSAFPVRLRALSLPMPERLGLTGVAVGVSSGSLTFSEDGGAGLYAGEATILVRVRGADGEPERKHSQQYNFTGKLSELSQIKAGGLLFFRTPELATGAHQVEAVVHDTAGDRASVARSTVEVPSPEAPVVGDLFVVSRAERVDPGAVDIVSHPLASQGILVYPSFGEPIDKQTQAELTFALPLVLDPAGPAAEASLELLQAGRVLAQLPLPLDEPDPQGRLLQISRLPTAAIPAGAYELRVTITAGGRQVVRSAGMTLR